MARPARAAASTLSNRRTAGLTHLLRVQRAVRGHVGERRQREAGQCGYPEWPGVSAGDPRRLWRHDHVAHAAPGQPAGGRRGRGGAALLLARTQSPAPLQLPARAVHSPTLRRVSCDTLSRRAQTEGTPANVLATLANTLLGAQQAFTKEGASAESLQARTTADKRPAHYNLEAPQVDPIPKVRADSAVALLWALASG